MTRMKSGMTRMKLGMTRMKLGMTGVKAGTRVLRHPPNEVIQSTSLALAENLSVKAYISEDLS